VAQSTKQLGLDAKPATPEANQFIFIRRW